MPGWHGPVSDGGCRRWRKCDVRCEADKLLRTDVTTLPFEFIKGHEGALRVGDVYGPPKGGKAGSSGGQLSQSVHRYSDGDGRWIMESGPIPGDAPAGSSIPGTGSSTSSSSSTRQAGEEITRCGRWSKKRKLQDTRVEEQLSTRGEGQRQRKRERWKRQRQGPRLWWCRRMAAGKLLERKSKLVGRQEGQGRKGWKGKEEGGQERRSMREGSGGSYEEGEEAFPAARGFDEFGWMIEKAESLRKIGVGLAWMYARGLVSLEEDRKLLAILAVVLGASAGNVAVHRPRNREVFPIPVGKLEMVLSALCKSSRSSIFSKEFVQEWCEDCWLLNSIRFLNSLNGSPRIMKGQWKSHHVKLVECVRASVKRTLAQDGKVARSGSEVEKELSSRYLTYSGEEVPKMEILTLRQVEAGLPPLGHGGLIEAEEWVTGRTRIFLLNPEDCVLSYEERGGEKKKRAKVHIAEGEKIPLAKELVRRGVCAWTEESKIFRVDDEPVLNGLFGVRKSTTIDSGEPVLRLIMNLIPTNAHMSQLRGVVDELPGVCQYLSIVLGEGEELRICQADMTSAFYLFKLPKKWRPYLTFDLWVSGSEIGQVEHKKFFLSCAVLPMGWGSAVGVMQEMSTNLLIWQGLPESSQVKKNKSLPQWLVEILAEETTCSKGWWHIYLDNFFSAEKVMCSSVGEEAELLHCMAEGCWDDVGVISSKKKRVANAVEAEELGARFGGNMQFLGVTGERLIRLCQTTLLVLSRTFLLRKWLEVVCGRWIHVLQFRRAGLSGLQYVWKVIHPRQSKREDAMNARRELFNLMLGCCLFHTFLGAQISEVCSASDASNKGGAVGIARSLTAEGQDVCRALQNSDEGVIKVPVLVLSLFNGIGGAFRCYDVLGVSASAILGFDTFKPANRVCSRRWGHAVLGEDVRSIDAALVRKWVFQYPHILVVHIWAGFPCVDLSSVKFGRKNLEGSQSSLVHEVLRVIKLVRAVFGQRIKISFFVENVASMDQSARDQISRMFGVRPYKVQCSQAVPLSRPRFCWTDIVLPKLEGVLQEDKGPYIELIAEAPYPETSSWLTPGARWPYESTDVVFPTCMKAIRRSRPPPAPAGLNRADQDCVDRWRADHFRYPPYQYKEEYVIWTEGGKWRLLNSEEREILHGYGASHTAVCWSASDIKANPTEYEDVRCSLLGDSFSIFSFVIFAWGALAAYLPKLSYLDLVSRMGLAPGFTSPISCRSPLSRRLSYGHAEGPTKDIRDLTGCFLARTNHTGSDVRIVTGKVMNPKAFPRQSVAAGWFNWQGVFHCKWARKDHINSLEMRAILLSLRHRIQHLREQEVRFAHLTDSYVSMSVISKGRSSSQMLTQVLKRINSYLLGFNLYMILLHVESTDNPTDEASHQ